ncbi:N-acetylmuramoyl-L-alanine amidase [Streptomyces chumphonensis]|uniref:N-acetylmuramoyl-L-alanine amidase n=1 Tax=Streptomyces chumphonensis TaxID=1214925 RepID=A0A927F543_9ACTN|nr:peptidoglycan recognition protein [Streptomyces chumphonensis]MBD3934537.1 N-acetylmuramoyl-L-alanine amidase [Streptomyces chumphonensis]
MRAHVTSSIGVVCSAALLVPLAPSHVAAATAPPPAPADAAVSAPPADGPAPHESAARPAGNRSLPLDRVPPTSSERAPGALAELTPREVEPFSLLGVAWEDAGQELHGRVRVRTRDARTGTWSDWRELAAHTDEAPDPATAEARAETVRGSTAPLWVGASDGVAVRVLPEPGTRTPVLPDGLRLEMVDPGSEPQDADGRPGGYLPPEPDAPAGAPADVPGAAAGPDTGSGPGPAAVRALGGSAAHGTPAAYRTSAEYRTDTGATGVRPSALAAPPELSAAAAAASAVNSQLADLGAELIPPRTRKQAVADVVAAHDGVFPVTAEGIAEGQQDPYVGPRPGIVTRNGWGADESLREGGFLYTDTVKAAFVHHTGGSNGYACSEAESVIRGIYRYHTVSLGWRDVGYNFFVDKCGQIYEGRAGGVTKPVMGAHTYGFNSNTMGIAVLGSYGGTDPSKAATDGIAKLTAWKLGLYGVDPNSSTTLVSGGGKYRKGARVTMRTISGHRDGFATECPGARLYAELGSIRALAAKLQGR